MGTARESQVSADLPVTVVIPTRDRKDLVTEAVASVLKQTFKDFELIVVDDGSEDGTREQLSARFSEPRLIYLRTENRGVSAARNLGVSSGRGRWIAFLDSDDLWEPLKLERQLGYLAENPDAEACYTGETWIRGGRFVNPRLVHAKKSGNVFSDCLPLCIISPSSIIMTRALFEELGGFDESLPACEDYDLWLRLAARRPVHLLDERLIIKRNGHEGQLSRAHFGLDRFRVRALWKLWHDLTVPLPLRLEALSFIKRKSAIVALGSEKRNERERAAIFRLSEREAARILSGGDEDALFRPGVVESPLVG